MEKLDGWRDGCIGRPWDETRPLLYMAIRSYSKQSSFDSLLQLPVHSPGIIGPRTTTTIFQNRRSEEKRDESSWPGQAEYEAERHEKIRDKLKVDC